MSSRTIEITAPQDAGTQTKTDNVQVVENTMKQLSWSDCWKPVALFASVGVGGLLASFTFALLLNYPKLHFLGWEFALLMFSLSNINLYILKQKPFIRPFWSLWGIYVSVTLMAITLSSLIFY